MKFSVLIINYNGGGRIKRCLEALAAQTCRDFEVLVLDNASKDGSEKATLPDDRFRWIISDKNLGFAGGNNRAAGDARGEWLFLLNPDAYAEPECLATLRAATLRHERDVLFGCTQLDDAVPEILDGVGDCYFAAGFPWRGGKGWPLESLPDEGEIFGPCGAALLIRRDVFETAGGFDEDFFCYCEDVDLAFRLRLMGHRALQISEAFVRHEGSGITASQSGFYHFHSTRNRLWTFLKNMPLPLLVALLPAHILLNLLLLLDAKNFSARWKGLNAGLKGLPRILAKRRATQKNRTESLFAIACALSWNPMRWLWRQADGRPVG